MTCHLILPHQNKIEEKWVVGRWVQRDSAVPSFSFFFLSKRSVGSAISMHTVLPNDMIWYHVIFTLSREESSHGMIQRSTGCLFRLWCDVQARYPLQQSLWINCTAQADHDSATSNVGHKHTLSTCTYRLTYLLIYLKHIDRTTPTNPRNSPLAFCLFSWT